jgi:hypothetical protein
MTTIPPNLFLAEAHSESFSISGGLFIAQILNLIVLIAYIWLVCKAIARACKVGKGVEVPIWIFAIVLLPIIGAIAALVHYQKPEQQ